MITKRCVTMKRNTATSILLTRFGLRDEKTNAGGHCVRKKKAHLEGVLRQLAG